MFLKEFDFLSPGITLYHKGLLYNTSTISIIISIIAIFEVILISIIYLSRLINRNNEVPKMSIFSSFIEDVGKTSINSSSLFHFININKDPKNPDEQSFDFENFRAIGFDTFTENYLLNKNISNYDHWLYGPCDKNDTKDIEYLITQDYFTKSACIKKFYNSKDKSYYDTNNIHFRWPKLEHGIYNKNNSFYVVLIEKCNEQSLNEIFNNNEKNAKIFQKIFLNLEISISILLINILIQ